MIDDEQGPVTGAECKVGDTPRPNLKEYQKLKE